jgi:ElaB/YqjD/DUF883 family membrane-anchored ribosome-binding protein
LAPFEIRKEKAMSSTNNYGSRIRQKGHEIAVDLGDIREIVKEAVGAKIESMKESASSMARRTGERATEAVRESPWKAMAGAAVAGMLVAWLFRRR